MWRLRRQSGWGRLRPAITLVFTFTLRLVAAWMTRFGELRTAVGTHAGVATTAGYGPRFLHSTGQLHKGGANNGLFLQIVDDTTANDVAVPETDYTFGQLIAAQSAGDAGALVQRGRRLLRVDLGADAGAGLERLVALFERLAAT